MQRCRGIGVCLYHGLGEQDVAQGELEGDADNFVGQSVPVPIHPSKVQITKLHMTGDRTKILQRKARAKLEAKGKISSSEVAKS